VSVSRTIYQKCGTKEKENRMIHYIAITNNV